MTEVQRADRRARRSAVIILMVGTVVGLALILLVPSRLASLQADLARTQDPRALAQRLRVVVWMLTIAFVVPVLGMATYLWRFASRIVAEDRFPPVGARLTRDVQVLLGSAAHRRARLFQAVAVVLSLAAIGFVTILWRLVAALQR